jgi:predicted glycosyltransferase
MNGKIKRALVYTHNSIGLGHAFRTLAVIAGIRKWRPDINFLVLSSSSIPQIFFDEGIEVVKLPSVKLDIERNENRLAPRYLSDFDLESVFDFRQRLILESFDFFKPDVLIVEHNMTGQMSEIIPLLMKKWMRKGGPADFALVHICRGIMKWVPLLTIPYENPRHRSESINIGALYDFMYVLEDRNVIDINKAFLGDDPELEKKIRYLGKITRKAYSEIPPRDQALRRLGLPDKRIILVTLGRKRCVANLSGKVLSCFHHAALAGDYHVVIVLDPYLDSEIVSSIREHQLADGVTFLPFTPDLVDLMRHSDLVICRAGYNIVNEILLTGVRAVLVPESHGSGEQEMRVKTVPRENILVFGEEEFCSERAQAAIVDLLQSPATRPPVAFDKYAVGKAIIEELENWRAQA